MLKRWRAKKNGSARPRLSSSWAPGLKGEYTAKMTLCKRAHAGIVRARAQRFIVGGGARDNVELPAVFWWG